MLMLLLLCGSFQRQNLSLLIKKTVEGVINHYDEIVEYTIKECKREKGLCPTIRWIKKWYVNYKNLIADTSKTRKFFEGLITCSLFKNYRVLKLWGLNATITCIIPRDNIPSDFRFFRRLFYLLILGPTEVLLVTKENVKKVYNYIIEKENVEVTSPYDALELARFYIRLYMEQGFRGDEWFFGSEFVNYRMFKEKFDNYYIKGQGRFKNFKAQEDIERLRGRNPFSEAHKKLRKKVISVVKEKIDGYEVELLTYNIWSGKIKKWRLKIKRDGRIE